MRFILLILQVDALPKTLEMQESAAISPTQESFCSVQRVYCNLFPAKPFYGSHRLDLVVIRPLGIDNGAFVVSPDSVWYARVLLLFSASAVTDTGCHWLQVLRLCPRVNSGNKR